MLREISKEEARAWGRDQARKITSWPSDALCAAIAATPQFQQAPIVAVFAARRGEPDLTALWRARPGACVYPRVTGPQTMRFHHLSRAEDLAPGFAGIAEPPATAPEADWTNGGLILVPGLAFDRVGGRVGSGAGFYDRYLAGRRLVLWAVGWERQIVAGRLAQEPSDARMAALCTENGVFRIGGEKAV